MTEKRKVIVKINGQDYTVIGEESEDYIKHIAKYVDEKAKEIYEKNNKFSQSMVAMLAAFTITDELYKTYQELNELKDSIVEPFNELDSIRKKSEKDDEKIGILEIENKEMKTELIDLRDKNSNNKDKVNRYEKSLKLKEEELENSQKIIAQLQNKLFENQLELVQLRKELDEAMKVYDEKQSINK